MMPNQWLAPKIPPPKPCGFEGATPGPSVLPEGGTLKCASIWGWCPLLLEILLIAATPRDSWFQLQTGLTSQKK